MTGTLRHRPPRNALPNIDTTEEDNAPCKESVSAEMRQQSTPSSRFFVFCLCAIFRLINASLTRTYDNPDEYWQSQEVAHHMVFGYGYLTWEWQARIRSYIHPLLFASLYKLLQVVHLDQTDLLIVAPKYLQAMLSALADYATYSLAKKVIGELIAPFILFITLSSWYNFFMAARTLSNSMEMVLTVVAFNYWPFPGVLALTEDKSWLKKYRIALFWASLACLMRPTGGIIWAFLGLDLLASSPKQYRFTLIANAALIMILALSLSCVVDTWSYTGSLTHLLDHPVLTPIEFVKVNVIQSVSLFYGVHTWHWYITQGFPVITTTLLPLAVYGTYKMSKSGGEQDWARGRSLVQCAAWVLGIYSLLAHKEFRFIYPILPIALILAAFGLSQLSRWRRWVAVGLIVSQLPMALYLSLWNQRGVMDVMFWLRKETPPSVGFLMPCHSTPWQSIVHNADMDMWFLTCEPNLSNDDDYVDEADQFYADPVSFLSRRFDQQRPACLVMFDSLLGIHRLGQPSVAKTLHDAGYHERQRFFNSHFHDDWRRRGDVLVLCQQAEAGIPY